MSDAVFTKPATIRALIKSELQSNADSASFFGNAKDAGELAERYERDISWNPKAAKIAETIRTSERLLRRAGARAAKQEAAITKAREKESAARTRAWEADPARIVEREESAAWLRRQGFAVAAPTPAKKHRSKAKHRAARRRRTVKEQALRNVEAASIRYVRAGKVQSSASGGPGADPRYERALTAAWKARASGPEIQAAMARGEARAGRHKARGRHR